MRVRPDGTELPYGALDAAHHEVVAEIHDEVVLAQKIAGDQHGVCESQWFRLWDVAHVETEFRAVPNGLTDFAESIADDDTDIGDAGCGDRLQSIEQDGFVGDRDQLLCGRVRDGPEASARAAC